MVIVARCESCSQRYALPEEAAGNLKKCRKCGKPLIVPGRPVPAKRSKKPRHPSTSRELQAQHRWSAPRVGIIPLRVPQRPYPDPPIAGALWELIYRHRRGVGILLAVAIAVAAIVVLVKLDYLTPKAGGPSKAAPESTAAPDSSGRTEDSQSELPILLEFSTEEVSDSQIGLENPRSAGGRGE